MADSKPIKKKPIKKQHNANYENLETTVTSSSERPPPPED